MKVWWLAGGAAVLAVAVVTAVVLNGPDKPAPVRVSTAKVTRAQVSTTVSASGTVQAQASRSLGFSGNGTLTELDVKAGDIVNPGAVLARIDSAAAQDSVDNAAENVTNAEDALTKAQDAAAKALATPTPSPTPTKTTAATTGGNTTGGNTAGGNTAGGNTAGGNTAGGSTGGGQTTAQSRANSIQSTSDNLFSAQQRLNNAKLSLTQANAKLAGTTIIAPVGGKILSVSGTVGSQAGSNVITLAGTGDVVIKAQFTEAEVAHLKVTQTAKVTLPDSASAKYDGKVLQIDPAGTTSNRLVRYAALISFDKVPDTLLYGQSATVAVVTESVDNALSVPSTAVHDGQVTVRVNGKNEKRAVEVGLRGDVNTEIKSGLAEGDEILTAGQ